eukprot:scaffold846_cov252-Pinguiococcus_pyrenoidosus.AAC.18
MMSTCGVCGAREKSSAALASAAIEHTFFGLTRLICSATDELQSATKVARRSIVTRTLEISGGGRFGAVELLRTSQRSTCG